MALVAGLLAVVTGYSVTSAVSGSPSSAAAATASDTSSPPYAATGYFSVAQKGERLDPGDSAR